MINFNSSEVTQQLLALCFYEASHAKLIISAHKQQIILVNEMFLDVFQVSEKAIIGKLWTSIDSKENHINYREYIKEINSNDRVEFIINHEIQHQEKHFKVEYYMGVLAGEVVYIGSIKPDNSTAIPANISKILTKIYNTNIVDLSFPTNLDEIIKKLDLSFITLIELHKEKYQSSISSGDKVTINNIIEEHFEALLTIINNQEDVLITANKSSMNAVVNIAKTNNLNSLCIFPIFHQEYILGAIVAGGKNAIEDQNIVSTILQVLSNKVKFCLFFKAITNEKQIEIRTDELTKLPNRNSMNKKFSEIMKIGINTDKYLALMIIDIHKMSFYNKKFGAEITDEIVINISKLIVRSVSSNGQTYRLSGNEFTVLLQPHIDKKLVETVAKKIINNIRKPFLLSNGEDVEVDFNIGISIFPDDGQTVSSMMKNADLALFDANLASKNNYVIFKYAETGRLLKQKTELEENLKKAIENNHIKVFYQPKIHAVSEDIVGFEALVRWIDPEIGLINPMQFIPIAEESGLIDEIGEIVAQQACEQLLIWHEKFELYLTCSINLSVEQLMNNRLSETLTKIISSAGIHPRYIDFEITETISLDNVPNLVEVLNEIVQIGCTLSIDDFGTGHSSLDYVKRIPADYIKIDKSFVANIDVSPEDEAILDATINIAKRLNRRIVAEGVETESQREYLFDRGCDYFQGYLFARPMPADEIDKLLAQRIELMGAN